MAEITEVPASGDHEDSFEESQGARRPYSKPNLVLYGSLGELTQRGSGRWSEWFWGPRQWDWRNSYEQSQGISENGQPM